MSKKNKSINNKHIKKLFNLFVIFFIISSIIITFNYNSLIITVSGQPGEPTDFNANAVGTDQIDLDWTLGLNCDKTYIEWNTTSGWNLGEGTELYNETSTGTSHFGLNAHNTYYYQAWGWNETDGYSISYVAADDITWNTPPDYGTPSPVNGSSGNNLSLTWSIFISDDDSDIFNWSIECSSGHTTSASGDSNGIKSLSISGLDFSTLYTVWVNATDGYDTTSAWFTFSTRDSFEPGAPSGFSASASGRFQINLVWVVGDNSDSTRVEWNSVDDVSWVVGDHSLLYNGSGNSASQSGLSPGTTRYYKAWSWNVTDSVWSSGVTDSATTNINNVPVFGAPSPVNGSIGIDFSLNWIIFISDDNGDTFDWNIECSNGQTNNANDDSNGTKSLSISGLAHSTLYTIWVNATDGYNTTHAWYTFTTRGAFEPAVPSSFIATSISTSQINIKWTIGSNTDKTYIEWNSTSSWNLGQGHLLYNGTGNATSHTGLNARTTYYYQAWSWNNSESLWSASYSDAHATTGGSGGGGGGGNEQQPSDNPPLISSVSRAPSLVTSENIVIISATITDDTGLYSVYLYWNDGSQHSQEMTLQSNNKYSAEIGPFAELITITYWINATDNSSQSTESTSYFFTVADSTGPSITIIKPLSGSTIYDATPIIKVSFSDPSEIDMAKVTLTIDDINKIIQEITSLSATYESTTEMTYITHTIKLNVSDKLGNWQIKEWSFTIKEPEFIIEETIGNLTSGQEKEINLGGSNETGIDSINFSTAASLINVKIFVIKLKDKPMQLDDLPTKTTLYCYLQIEITADDENIDDDSFNSLNVKFKVENDWLINNSLEKNNINLISYQNGGWVTLDADNLNQDSLYTYYSSSLSTFSNLAIVGIKTTAEGNIPALEFNYIFVVIAVILVIVLIVFVLFKTGILYIEE